MALASPRQLQPQTSHDQRTSYVVGLGPGDARCLTPQARAVLDQAACIAGYQLYLDLVPPELLRGKAVISTGMRHEEERCAAAVDAALSGRSTALVCPAIPASTPWPG